MRSSRLGIYDQGRMTLKPHAHENAPSPEASFRAGLKMRERWFLNHSRAGGRMIKLLTQAYDRWRLLRSYRLLVRVRGVRFDTQVVGMIAQMPNDSIEFLPQCILDGFTTARSDANAVDSSAESLSRAYRRLPRTQRRMLLLYEYRGLGHELIAQRLGITKKEALQQLAASVVQFEHEVRLLDRQMK